MNSTTLLPPNESEFLKAKELAYRSAINANDARLVLDPMTCDEKLLPHLAQVVQVLFWSEELATKEKRKLISETLEMHKHVGTPYALKKVFELLELNVKIVEWFEEKDKLEPYHFYVEVTLGEKEITTTFVQQIHKYIEVHKNVRSELDFLSIFSSLKTEMYTHGGMVTETHSQSFMTKLYEITAQTKPHTHGGMVTEVHTSISNNKEA